ncbi:hypothetical protein VNI00_013029 [Paramarasmius palmivorus]|uniref:Transmembrane protein n=1 Tax=Paramarasmius palmivorus TaxID=297713 RepID=A0AAW0C0G8_9AGAR
MSKLAWSTIMIMPLTLLIAVNVQSFYIVRIYQMSYRKDWVVPMLLSFLMVTEIVLSAVAIAGIYQLQSLDRIAEDAATRRVMYAEFSSVVACDVSCALALSYYLHKGRSGIRSLNMRKSLDNSTTITVNMESVELGTFQAVGRTTIASMNAPIESSVIDPKVEPRQ